MLGRCWKATRPFALYKMVRPHEWETLRRVNRAVRFIIAFHERLPALKVELGGWAQFAKAAKNWSDKLVMKDGRICD